MHRRKPLFIIVVFFLALFVLTSCGKSKTAGEASKKKIPSTAHVVSKKEKAAILRDARRAIKLLRRVEDDTGTLDNFLADPLLKQTAKDIDTEIQAGRIKIWRLDDVKLELVNYTSGVAGLSLKYKNNSHFIDKNSRERLTEPTGKLTKLGLGLKKLKGRWKIYVILGTVKPEMMQPDNKATKESTT